MMTRLNRILSLLMVLTVPVFLTACEGDDRDIEDSEFGAETEGMEQTPMEPAPMDGAGTFTTWDADQDGALNEDEFGGAVTQGDGWMDWDSDANTTLNQDEFNTAFSDRTWYEQNMFDEWDEDGDGEITRDEWESGLFSALDENNDGRIQEEEFDPNLFHSPGMM